MYLVQLCVRVISLNHHFPKKTRRTWESCRGGLKLDILPNFSVHSLLFIRIPFAFSNEWDHDISPCFTADRTIPGLNGRSKETSVMPFIRFFIAEAYCQISSFACYHLISEALLEI